MRSSRFWLTFCLALPILAAESFGVHLRGQIVRVGYPGSGSSTVNRTGTADLYRLGCWTPVLVELANDDGDEFTGTIEVRQVDGDGDELVGTREVSVRGTRPFFLYVPGGLQEQGAFVRGLGYDGPAPFSVRLLDSEGRLANLHDDKGEPVRELAPPREVMQVGAADLLLLDISQPALNPLDKLRSTEHLSRDVYVARVGCKELPDHFSGLEPVDVIVWDSPEPGALDSLQDEAIIEWVKRGGRLIIGVSKNWNLLSAAEGWGALLPARLHETAKADAKMLGAVLKYVDASDQPAGPLPKSLGYTPVVRADLAGDATPVIPPSPADDEQIWVARRSCGRGEIILVTAELREMATVPGFVERLRSSVLRLRVSANVDNQNQSGGHFGATDLFQPVAAETAFKMISSVFFAFAFAFVIAYIVIATAGCWGWLRRRSHPRHAWVAFALVAVVASAASLGAVQLVRALGQGVHEMTIVDGRAGSFDAAATSYLGYKTASHTHIDLCVPSRWDKPAESMELRASLRPAPPIGDSNQQNAFSVSQSYQVVATLGELRSVPVRATLKQFSAGWRGELNGRIAASFTRRSSDAAALDGSSWIENQLNTDLRHCYVFVRNRSSSAIATYFIPELKNGQKVIWSELVAWMREKHDEKLDGLRRPLGKDRLDLLEEGKEKPPWSPPLLRVMLGQSFDQLAMPSNRTSEERDREMPLYALNTPRYVPALVALTFFDDAALKGILEQYQEPQRSDGERLEMSAEVTPGQALFVGFSEDLSPVRLCRRNPGADAEDWKAMTPSESTVMYRFLVPVQ